MVERSKLLIACETTGLWGKKNKNKTAIIRSGVIRIPRDRPRGFLRVTPSFLASHSTPRTMRYTHLLQKSNKILLAVYTMIHVAHE